MYMYFLYDYLEKKIIQFNVIYKNVKSLKNYLKFVFCYIIISTPYPRSKLYIAEPQIAVNF